MATAQYILGKPLVEFLLLGDYMLYHNATLESSLLVNLTHQYITFLVSYLYLFNF